jgi:hypothetical protein
VIVAVAVSDVRAAAVIQFDFEAVTDVAGVVDDVEVIDGSVSDAGLDAATGED